MIKELKKMQSDIADLEAAISGYCDRVKDKTEEGDSEDSGKTKARAVSKMGTQPLMLHPQVYASKEIARAVSEDPELAAILGKLKDMF